MAKREEDRNRGRAKEAKTKRADESTRNMEIWKITKYGKTKREII